MLRDRFGDAARSFSRVFRNPNIRRLEGAWAVSIITYWAYGIALAVFAYGEGGAAAVGLVGLVRFIPSAIASPFTAMLADRYRRQIVIIVAELLRASFVALTVVVLLLDGPFALVLLLSALVAIVNSAEGPAESALLPTLAETPRELTAANVVSSTIESLGIFGGPAIGGLLLAATSPEVVFAAAAVAFTLSAFLVSRVRVEGQQERPEPTGGAVRELTAGFVTLAREPGLRVLVGLLAAQTLVAGALNVLIVVSALRLLDLGEEGVGFLNSAVGIGGLVGAVVSAALIGRRLTSNFLVGILLWGLPIALIGLFPEPVPALIFLAVVGLGNTLVDVSAFTLLQRAVPDEVLARVFGAVQALWVGAIGIGAIIAPLLIAALDIRGALIVTGALLPDPRDRCFAGNSRRSTRCRSRSGSFSCSAASRSSSRCRRRCSRASPTLWFRCVSQPGREVFREGELGDRFYIVADGEVEIIQGGEVVNLTGPGGFFGEISLLRDVPRTATVRAKTEVELRALERDEFIAAVTGHAASAEAADSVVATRLSSLRPGLASV